jgi:uncharacterized protein YbjT (DUF2867 family)
MLLVTGATGNVGKAVIQALADRGISVRALVRDPTRLPIDRPANLDVMTGDLADEESLTRALHGVESAFLASSFNPRMVELQSRFIGAAKAAGVKRLVQLSGVGADARMCCARTLRWLGQIETIAKSSGLAVTHLRPTFYMQNLLAFAPTIATQGVIAGPFRSTKWTWVDARDVGAVAAVALAEDRHAGQTYTITGSESLTYQEVADRLGRALHRPIKYLDVTANETRGRLQAAGESPVMIEAKLELWDACASNLVNVAPTTVVKDLTGQEPRSIEQFVQDYRERLVARPAA